MRYFSPGGRVCGIGPGVSAQKLLKGLQFQYTVPV
jgi:hypothetical protein